VDDNMSTLMDFRYKRKYTAGNGGHGDIKRCSGKDGERICASRCPGAPSSATPKPAP
jgi:GTPase involved in cell partitioning and DNA repair